MYWTGMTTMSDFEGAVNYVLRHEGGLIDNVHDNGGITHHGISLRFLRNLSQSELKKIHIYEEPNEQTVRDLTMNQAKNIYFLHFWNLAPFEKILNQEHCNYIFDMAVSMGIAPAIKCVQRATWSVVRKRELSDDGILGEKTLHAINQQCGFLIMPALRSERAGYYRLVVSHSSDEKEFINGWLNRAYCSS